MSIGISHGSLDNLKGKKLLKIFKIKEIEKFYTAYVCLAIFIILLWILFPNFLLMIFSFSRKLPFWQRGYGF